MNDADTRSVKTSVVALIPAAGHGARFGSEYPKQYAPLHGATVLDCTLQRIRACPAVCRIVLALSADDPNLAQPPWPDVDLVVGGTDRAQSVLAMLNRLSDESGNTWVAVHDAARPCLRPDDFSALIAAVSSTSACGGILASRVRETVKRVDPANHVQATVPREDLWLAATPQLFRLDDLRAALESALEAGVPVTDEASAMEWAGHPVLVVEGQDDNIKITRPADLGLAASILEYQQHEF